jgi:hypothetical protein
MNDKAAATFVISIANVAREVSHVTVLLILLVKNLKTFMQELVKKVKLRIHLLPLEAQNFPVQRPSMILL